MTQKNLSLWLKAIIIAMAVAGIALFFVFVPIVGLNAVDSGTINLTAAWLWFAFLCGTAIPCYLVLFWCWLLSCDVGKNESFTRKNSVRFKNIMIACLVNTVFLFVGNLIFYLLNASTLTVFLSFLFISFAGVVLSIASGCLSHLVYKAALIREENEEFV